MNVKTFRNYSIKTKVALLSLTLCLFSIWTLALIASSMLHKNNERQLGEQLFSTASFVAASVNDDLTERMNALKMIATAIDAPLLDNPSELQKLVEERPILQMLFNAGIFVTRLDGTAIAENPRIGRVGLNYMDKDHIAAALKEGKSTLGKPVIGKRVVAPSFAITVPIHDKQGMVIGALAGATDLSKPNFLDKVTNGGFGKTGGFLLIAPQYRLIVTATDKSRIMKEVPAPGVAPLNDRFIGGYEGTGVLVMTNGVEALASAKRVPMAGWFVTALLPTAEAYAPTNKVQIHILLYTSIFSLLIGCIIWFMLRRLLSPISTTIESLTAIQASGLPWQPLPTTNQNEVGQLIGSFNSLLETLALKESVLRAEEARFRTLANSAPVLIWIAGTDKLCTWFNKVWTDFTGRTMEQELGNGWAEGVHPDDFDRCLEIYGTSFDKRLPFSMEYRLRGADGPYQWFLDNGVPIYEQDEFKGYIGSCFDITSRKLIQDDLALHKNLLQTLMNHIPDLIWLKDVDGVYLFCNARFGQIFGMIETDVVGKNDYDLFDSDQADLYRKNDLLAIQSGKLVSNEELVTYTDGGQTLLVETHKSSVFNNDGKIVGVLGVARDISERKIIESNIEQKQNALSIQNIELLGSEQTLLVRIEEYEAIQKNLQEATLAAESANVAKSQFLACMSHELRTPLNGVLGNAQLLQLTDMTEEQEEYVTELTSSGKNLLSLISDILDLSKIEAGKINVRLAQFNIHRCVNDLVLLQKFVKKEKGPVLNVDIAEDVPKFVCGDQLRFKQILLNLLGNAIKFTVQGTITVSMQLLERISDSVLVQISVQDTGIGVAPELLDEIFMPFTQADASTTRKYGGSGLGLTISRRLAELLGGTVTVDSSLGIGSCFTMVLPFTIVKEDDIIVEAPSKETINCNGQPMRILLVENDQINITFGIALLKKLGHDYTVAKDGRECLSVMAQGTFDLVLMDIHMPVMGGEETLKEIRKKECGTLKHQPVIALTAYAQRAEMDCFLEQGFDGYVSKPLDIRDLVHEMNRVIVQIHESDRENHG